jgi:hypothetical protein
MAKTMNGRTKEALLGSILKWQKVLNRTGLEESASNCPLCQLFHSNDCNSCPVKKAAKARFCDKTPFIDWYAACDNDAATNLDIKLTRAQREAAKAELNFLLSLLPEDMIPPKNLSTRR